MKFYILFILLFSCSALFGQNNLSGTYSIIKYERNSKLTLFDGKDKSYLYTETIFEGDSNATITFTEEGIVITKGSLLCASTTNDDGEIYEDTEEVNIDDEATYSIENNELLISSGQLMNFSILKTNNGSYIIEYNDRTEDIDEIKDAKLLLEIKK